MKFWCRKTKWDKFPLLVVPGSLSARTNTSSQENSRVIISAVVLNFQPIVQDGFLISGFLSESDWHLCMSNKIVIGFFFFYFQSDPLYVPVKFNDSDKESSRSSSFSEPNDNSKYDRSPS